MKLDYLRAVCSTLILAGAFVGLAPETAHAQGRKQEESKPARPVAEMIDEYGRLRHCDWSARLDQLATKLQNEPTTTAYIVSFDALEKNRDFAESELRMSHFYLTHVRGIDASRVMLANGGGRADVDKSLTQLWTVPEGAMPPVAPPEKDKFTAKDFSGRFDAYSTDENIYKVIVEMGYTSEEVSHVQFAAKLKQQPESVGYLVIRASKNSPPGAWRRIARRDEGILQKEHGVEAARLKSIDGGHSGSDYTEVELWVLPASAPPPAGLAEKIETKPRAAYKLNRYDSSGSPDADAEQWMLENLAEALRADPQASGYFIVREPVEQAEIDGEEPAANDAGEAAQVAEESLPVEENSPRVTGASAENSVEAGEPETETMMETAARWRKILSEKHGIEPHRIVFVEGRRMSWSAMRLTTWVVPEKARPPDALARDEDDPEDEIQESTGAQEGALEVAPPTTIRASGVAAEPSSRL